jgi:hypothetical protein
MMAMPKQNSQHSYQTIKIQVLSQNFSQKYHSRVSVSLNPSNAHATIQFKQSSKQYHTIYYQSWITKDFIKLVTGLGYKKNNCFSMDSKEPQG